MTVIVDKTVERARDVLVDRIIALRPEGKVEAWLFEDMAARKAAEARLADAGITARFRSSYKPLLHFLLEELDFTRLTRLSVTYPVVPNTSEKRFLLETYPLAALCTECTLSLSPMACETPVYGVEAEDRDGTVATHTVPAPNRWHVDLTGAELLSPTGWLRIPALAIDEAVTTDFETLYAEAVTRVAEQDFGEDQPYFEELNIRIALPAEDRALGWGDEVLSLREAMHEDVYFSLSEIFQARTSGDSTARSARPGQIVPQISRCGDMPSVRVETRPLSANEPSQPWQRLATATHPLAMDQVQHELDGLGGQSLAAHSRAGRAVPGVYRSGSDAGVIISGAQHANETTGVVGALRAAQALAQRPDAHFCVSPVENPDGYALHHRLRAENARHMHHAARYTGFGDDVESRGDTPVHESAIRQDALALMDANLHINLHGYPAHEWTRPLSGYLPRGFELWTIPKGFFVIMRHHESWTETATALVKRLTERLADIPGLVDFNRKQIAAYEAHAGPASTFSILNGIPVSQVCMARHKIPLTLITEFPDETIYGDAFVFGHSVQMQTTIAAYEIYQDLAAASA